MLTLYHTEGCHLCEQAKALVMACFAERGIAPDRLSLADIAEEGELQERYGLLIPVLRGEASGQEVNWPFELNDIRCLLSALPGQGIR